MMRGTVIAVNTMTVPTRVVTGLISRLVGREVTPSIRIVSVVSVVAAASATGYRSIRGHFLVSSVCVLALFCQIHRLLGRGLCRHSLGRLGTQPPWKSLFEFVRLMSRCIKAPVGSQHGRLITIITWN